MSFSVLKNSAVMNGYGYGLTTGTSGLYNGANAEGIKDRQATNFDINASSRGYYNKAAVSSSNYAQQCQTIQQLLLEGRQDDAAKKYNQLLKEMKNDPYYQNFSENEIKTLLQEKYITSTNTSLANDIETNGQASFVSGLNSSIPIVGTLTQLTSKDELKAHATGTDVSSKAQVSSALGTATGMAATTAVGAAIGAAKGKGIIGAAIGGAIAVGSTILNKIVKANKTQA